jgi:hypothetical protein
VTGWGPLEPPAVPEARPNQPSPREETYPSGAADGDTEGSATDGDTEGGATDGAAQLARDPTVTCRAQVGGLQAPFPCT